MTLTKYYYIWKINLLNTINYAGDLFAGTGFVILILFIFTNLWQAIYTPGQIIAGYTIVMMMWYMVMTEAIVTASPSNILEEIGEEIRSGEIANYLNKPYHYIPYKIATSLGPALFKFTSTLILGVIIVSVLLGTLKINLLTLPLTLISAILGIILSITMMSFLGMFAFWFEDSKSLYLIYQKTIFILGGMLIPLELYPVWLKGILHILPFSSAAYAPAKLFVNFTMTGFGKTIIMQTIWITIFVILTYIIYKIGEKRVSINGG